MKAEGSQAWERFGFMWSSNPDHRGSSSCWPNRKVVIGGADPMPTEIPRDEEESDKDMPGLVDSSSDDDAYARPDEREETVQVGDAQFAQFSTLAQAVEASEEVPRIRHLSTSTLARADLSTHVLIGGSGHSSIAEAPAPGD